MQSSSPTINGISNSLGATTDVEGPNKKKKQSSGVTVNLLHKLTELVAYTSTVASGAYHNLTGNSGNDTDAESNYDDYDEVMQINTDDDFVDSEPPPPYESTWSPVTSPTSSSSINHAATPAITTNKPSSRRKQIRVRRGRRLIRHRSSSNASMTNLNALDFQCDDEEDEEFLNFNYKLVDLIVEGKAALTSTVVVTDVEFLMSEEKEREERIMRELGIQTPVTRRSRSSTCSSMSSDSDSILSPTPSINPCYGYYPPLPGPPRECSTGLPTQYGFPVYFKTNNCPSNYGYVGHRENVATTYSHNPGDSDGLSGYRTASYGYNMYY